MADEVTDEDIEFGYTVKEIAPGSCSGARVEMRCELCGCTDIEVHAWAVWDKTKQEWVLNELDECADGCYCPECGDQGCPWDEYNI